MAAQERRHVRNYLVEDERERLALPNRDALLDGRARLFQADARHVLQHPDRQGGVLEPPPAVGIRHDDVFISGRVNHGPYAGDIFARGPADLQLKPVDPRGPGTGGEVGHFLWRTQGNGDVEREPFLAQAAEQNVTGDVDDLPEQVPARYLEH